MSTEFEPLSGLPTGGGMFRSSFVNNAIQNKKNMKDTYKLRGTADVNGT